MTKIVTAILARNEADRYLQRVLEDCRRFSDEILVLDDRSTDNTIEVARKAGATVRRRSGPAMWGQEAKARKELWDWGVGVCKDGFLYVSDADHLMVGDPRPLCSSWNINAWCYQLYDTWDTEDQHRSDGYWAGFQHHRPWLFRPVMQPEGWKPEWSDRGIHPGHAPSNYLYLAANAPEGHYLLHLGWLRATDRREKYERYRAQWDQMSPFERAHVESINEVACR